MVAYTEEDQARVAAIAFTGNVNDQKGYLTTIRGLERIFRGVKRLAIILDGSAEEYQELASGIKITAVQILRDAFLSADSHPFVMAESNEEDPRAILAELNNLFNSAGTSISELRWRSAVTELNDGTMQENESVHSHRVHCTLYSLWSIYSTLHTYSLE